MSDSKEIRIREPGTRRQASELEEQKTWLAFEAQLLDYHIQQAKNLCRVDFVPQQYQGKEANCLFAIQMGHALGLNPTQSLQTIAVINGKAAVYGDGLIAAVRGSGLCEWIKEEGEPGVSATCTSKRKGEDQPISRTFTMEMAKQAGLAEKDKSPWKSYPDRMMQMRARAWCLRDLYADVLMGIQSAEEVRDVEFQGSLPAEVLAPAKTAPALPESLSEPRPNLGYPEAVSLLREPEDLSTLLQHKDLVAKGDFTEQQRAELNDLYKRRKEEIKAKQKVAEPEQEA